jgi:hypothetical protein
VLSAYKILSNILLARLTPYVNEVTGGHQCGVCHNKSTDQIFPHLADTRKKWKYNGMVHQLFTEMRFVAFPATEYDEVLSGYQPGQKVER